MNYYNERDKKAAAWLKQLIFDGHIPKGEVDERSIEEVTATDLAGFRQHHFFAGVGGWSYALRIVGWPDDKPIWTGSCPCQPFSVAGRKLADKDPRHLWPVWFQLIRKCRPDECFGEQVEAAIRLGWLDGIRADLEGEKYTLGVCVLGAHSVRAPNIRQRLYWLAHSNSHELQGISSAREQPLREQGEGDLRRMADSNGGKEHTSDAGGFHAESGARGNTSDGMADAARGGRGEQQGTDRAGCGGHPDGGGATIGSGGLGDTSSERSAPGIPEPAQWKEGVAGKPVNAGNSCGSRNTSSSAGFWDRFDIINFKDGKTRRIEPGLEPLVNGVPCRVDLLRGYGNAINPWTAAEFIKAYCEVRNIKLKP